MARVKRGTTTHAHHTKVIKAQRAIMDVAEYIRTATQAVDKARQYAYRDRRVREGNFVLGFNGSMQQHAFMV